jgi:hypothetical protein
MLIATKQILCRAKDGTTASKLRVQLAKAHNIGLIERDGVILRAEPYQVFLEETWAQEMDCEYIDDREAPKVSVRIVDHVESPRKLALHFANGQTVIGDGFEYSVSEVVTKNYPADTMMGQIIETVSNAHQIAAATAY